MEVVEKRKGSRAREERRRLYLRVSTWDVPHRKKRSLGGTGEKGPKGDIETTPRAVLKK